jgi:hypothetical protein
MNLKSYKEFIAEGQTWMKTVLDAENRLRYVNVKVTIIGVPRIIIEYLKAKKLKVT